MRVGRDGALTDVDYDEEEEIPSYFQPKTPAHSLSGVPECLDCRQWAVIAHAYGSSVQMFCVPLGYNDPASNVSKESLNDDVPFYLTAKIVLHDVIFIHDGEHSALLMLRVTLSSAE